MTTITCPQTEGNTAAAELPERHPGLVGHMVEWERYMRLAHYYRWRAPPGEDEDLVQAIIAEMARRHPTPTSEALPAMWLPTSGGSGVRGPSPSIAQCKARME